MHFLSEASLKWLKLLNVTFHVHDGSLIGFLPFFHSSVHQHTKEESVVKIFVILLFSSVGSSGGALLPHFIISVKKKKA